MQVPLRTLFLWLSVYACLFGVVAALPVPNVQLVAAVTVVTSFVVMDSRRGSNGCHAVPILARCSITLAYYALAFAASVAVCYALYVLVPEPPTPPKPATSFFSGIWQVVSGQLIAEAIGRKIRTVSTYYVLFAMFSAIAFCSSLLALRHFGTAKWLLVLSSPGACLFAFIAVAEIIESAEG